MGPVGLRMMEAGMATVRGCEFPEHLFYDVPHHAWYAPAGEGLLRVGLTCVAVALAREVLVFTPRRPGTRFEAGRSFATIESAKWVGAVRAAFDGTVAEVNEALMANATAANGDCYGAAWMMLVRPAAPDWQGKLITGAAVGPAYEAWMDGEGFEGCG